MSSSNTPNSEQIINDIKSLQQLEQQMFSSLESDYTLSNSQKNEIVDKISKLSKMRMNLYDTMGGMNTFFQKSFKTTRGTLSEQINSVEIIENELAD